MRFFLSSKVQEKTGFGDQEEKASRRLGAANQTHWGQ
jgi:hypothetical protein